MHFFADNDISKRIALARHELSDFDGNTVEHQTQSFPPDTPDTVWGPAIAQRDSKPSLEVRLNKCAALLRRRYDRTSSFHSLAFRP